MAKHDPNNDRMYRRPTAWRKAKEAFRDNAVTPALEALEQFGCPRHALVAVIRHFLSLPREQQARIIIYADEAGNPTKESFAPSDPPDKSPPRPEPVRARATDFTGWGFRIDTPRGKFTFRLSDPRVVNRRAFVLALDEMKAWISMDGEELNHLMRVAQVMACLWQRDREHPDSEWGRAAGKRNPLPYPRKPVPVPSETLSAKANAKYADDFEAAAAKIMGQKGPASHA